MLLLRLLSTVLALALLWLGTTASIELLNTPNTGAALIGISVLLTTLYISGRLVYYVWHRQLHEWYERFTNEEKETK